MSKYLKLLLFLTLVASIYASIARGHLTLRDPSNWLEVKSNPAKQKHVNEDMPTKSDLAVYLKSLDKIIKFSAANMNDIDLNFAFGLFLVNVNLKTILKYKRMSTPLPVSQPIRALVKKNTALLRFFQHMVNKDKASRNKQSKAIYSLFANDTLWIEQLEHYDAVFKTAERKRSIKELTTIYKTWDQYTKHIFDWEKRSIPGPKLSDYCLSALGKSEVKIQNSVSVCVLPRECHYILVNGSSSGYALTHRMLLMMLAQYGRGCSLLSPVDDREMTARLCSAAYAEAQYIAINHYQVIDLLMEQISFCTIEGHTEFLQRSWLAAALKRQTSSGCFWLTKEVQKMHKKKYQRSRRWMLAKSLSQQTIQGENCNGHLTAAVAAALSGAVRFIVTNAKYPHYKNIQK